MKNSNKKSILSFFPKPVNLTEISILSGYEIIFYFIVFIICLGLYFSWTKVPEKSIEIVNERIDTLDFTYNLDNYKSSFSIVDINFPLSNATFTEKKKPTMTITSNYCYEMDPIEDFSRYDLLLKDKYYNNKYSISFGYDSAIVNQKKADLKSRDSSLKGSAKYIRNNKDNKKFLDSLLNIYDSVYPKELPKYKEPLYYANVITEQTGVIRIGWSKRNKEESIKENYFYINKFYHDIAFTHTKLSNEFFYPTHIDNSITETGGVMNRPSILDLYDISQCYYKIHVKTATLDSIRICLNFQGANEFIFVENEPTEIKGQSLYYIINTHDDSIVLHVKSKELENKQNSRVFFITAVLSGLIVLFLAFIILLLYRIFALRKLDKNKLNIENSDNKDSNGKNDETLDVKSTENPQQNIDVKNTSQNEDSSSKIAIDGFTKDNENYLKTSNDASSNDETINEK